MLGQAAYSIYKSRKREFIINKQKELSTSEVPDEIVNMFVEAQSGYTLDLYKFQAKRTFEDFLDEAYSEQIAKMRTQIEKEYMQKMEDFAKNIQPHSWWYGVWQSFAASFLFVMAGYVILKMSGSWDLILNAIFK